jgi:hypothetical protein
LLLDVLLLCLFTIVAGGIVIVFVHYGRWMYCYCVCSLYKHNNNTSSNNSEQTQ